MHTDEDGAAMARLGGSVSVSGLCCRNWGKGQEILLKWPAIARRSLVLGALVETDREQEDRNRRCLSGCPQTGEGRCDFWGLNCL